MSALNEWVSAEQAQPTFTSKLIFNNNNIFILNMIIIIIIDIICYTYSGNNLPRHRLASVTVSGPPLP